MLTACKEVKNKDQRQQVSSVDLFTNGFKRPSLCSYVSERGACSYVSNRSTCILEVSMAKAHRVSGERQREDAESRGENISVNWNSCMHKLVDAVFAISMSVRKHKA